MMKELSLKEIQEVSLSILKDIHSFCEKETISYSVSGGTLLGAIRHKGFIPWDDDIDVMMPREDYEKFCKEYNAERYKVFSLNNDKSCKIAYARVCDMTQTLVKEQAWTSTKVGVWVDVFPFDGAEDDYEEFKNHYSSIKKIWASLFYNRALGGGVKPSNSNKLNVTIKALSSLHLLWINDMIARIKVKRINTKAQSIAYGTTHHVSQFAFLEPGFKEYFELDAFSNTVLVPFEDTVVRAISGYDHYLTHFYGSYMELPPIEQRVPKQDYLKFVWREL